MFFGLTNSPSTFQEMMNVIYKEVIEKHAARGTIIRIYMDDITIATTGTLQDHIDAVHDCHGSARTPLGMHANGEDSGLEESRKAICT
jgi:hypothetical protein